MRAKRFLAILLCCLLIGNIFPSRVSAAEGTVVDTETPAEAEKAAPVQESGTGQTEIRDAAVPETEGADESRTAPEVKEKEEEPDAPPAAPADPPAPEEPSEPEAAGPAEEPEKAEPEATEPAKTEPEEDEPAATEPEATEPAISEQKEDEPAEAEPEKDEPAAAEKGETEQAGEAKAASGAASDADREAPEEAGKGSTATERSYPAFSKSMTVSGVTVTVRAQEGTFPEGAVLSVVSVPTSRVESDIEKERDEEQNVVVSYTFDIKVRDKDGTELQPAGGSPVQVSFRTSEVADPNLDTNVYHLPEDGGAEELDVDVSGSTAITETDGFSLYTVEFTYNEMQYVLEGGRSVPLRDIVRSVGLVGEASGAQVSDAGLFSVSNGTGEWVVTSHKPFSSQEWLLVTIDDREYRITVTDDGETGGECGDNLTWSLDGETLTISGSGYMWDFSSYAPWYEHVRDIKTVELPEGLTSIGDFAFMGCGGLGNIDIPDNVTSIGSYAFVGCRSLGNIDIPDNVTSIGKSAFSGCETFTSIEIPAHVTSINEASFLNCVNLQSIKLPAGVASIKNNAFDGCRNLHDIYFAGTKDDWEHVTTGANWDSCCPDDMKVHFPCTVTVSAKPAAGGVAAGGGDTYTDTDVEVKATPNNGYVFVNWTIDGKVVSTEPEDAVNVAGSCTLVAHFEKLLTITAKSKSSDYNGQTQGEGDTTYNNNFVSIVEIDGLREGDQLSQIEISSQGKDADKYPITLKYAGVKDSSGKDVTSEYAVTYVPGVFTIEPKDVTVTTGTESKTYDGKPLTNDTATIDGLVPGEIATVKATGTRTDEGGSSNTYSIVWDTAKAKNYKVKESLGTLTVFPAKATITVDNASKVRGEKDPAFTGKVEGLVKDGDLGEISYTRTNTDEDPGTYAKVLTAGYEPNSNYNVTVKNGDFTIREVFTLKWLDADGSVLQSKTYPEGERPPVYDGREPVKTHTARYSYTFSGWDGGTVDGTVTTFRPLFLETVNRYKVTFLDEDGKTVLKEAAEYDYGTAADRIKKPKDPTKAADAKNTYTFAGWDPKVTQVTGDATYKATYIATPVPVKKGTLTFNLNGGTLDGKTGSFTIKAKVGDTIKLPGAPKREGYTFRFWKGSEYKAGADYKVKGDHTFTAEWVKNGGSSSKGGSSGGRSGSTSARTGDDTPAVRWLLILGASALAIAAVLFIKRRRKV